MSKHKIEVVVDYHSILGEGPVWDHRRGRIFWVDITRGDIHSFNPSKRQFSTVHLERNVGAIALTENESLIAAVRGGFGVVDFERGAFKMIREVEEDIPGNRFNDGKCDPAGRFWAGTMADDEQAGAGALYMVDHDLSVTLRIPKVTCSNGLAWSHDHKTLYYIDTPTCCVMAYDYDLSTGAIVNGRSVIKFEAEAGYPDGMTIDADGMLWVALWDGWKIVRCDPSSGKHLVEIPLPASRITSCAFGGENLEDMYITSAREGLSEEDLAAQKAAGYLFVIKGSGYRGVKADEFSRLSSGTEKL